MASGGSPFAWPQSRDIHIITLVPATLSFLATATGSYWFLALIKAQRNFRRTLVLVLILADCSKSFWIVVFGIVGLATNNDIHPRSTFCQAGGFLLQASFEACDLAILLLITHVSFQILPPVCIKRSQDGLWRQRYWILPMAVLLPVIDASLPFLRTPNPAYTFDGVYCSLFAGPLWLSLVLSWIPRYILWLYLLILLLRLYFYIRAQSSLGRRESFCSGNSEFSGQPSSSKELGTYNDPLATDSGIRQQSIAGSINTISSRRQKPNKQFQTVALYPFFYILAWSVPFSAQVTAFSTSQSINARYGLRAAAVCCVASLGIVDVVIFCLKEKPWRYSLQVRKKIQQRQNSAAEARDVDKDSNSGVQADRRPLGGGSDHDRRKTLLAYERLALEQADVLSRPKMRRGVSEHDLARSGPADLVVIPSPVEDIPTTPGSTREA